MPHSRLSRRALLALTPAMVLTGCSLNAGEEPQPSFTYIKPAFEGRAAKQVALNEELLGKGLALGNPVLIRVFKETSTLEVWMLRNDVTRFERIRSYAICAFSGHLGPKFREGDRQAPEGFYTLDLRRIRASNNLHLFMELDFPNAVDRARNRTGSWLGIHGGCSSIGCYAMTDQGIEEIYLLVEAGLLTSQRVVEVHAFPFRMSAGRMEQEKDSPYFAFWQQLQPAYMAFNRTGFPPHIRSNGRNYAIEPVYEVEQY